MPGRQFWSGQAVRLKDGGGIISDADWMVPKGDDCLGALRRVFYASHFILESACAAVGPCCRCQALLNEREVCVLQQDMVAFLTSEGFLCSAVVDKGQPLTLSIWDALLKFLGDVGAHWHFDRHSHVRGMAASYQLSRIWEKVELPSLADVAQFVSRHQGTAWHAFSLDIAKAHKRIRVCRAERGLSLFAVVDGSGATRWLVYNTTHFGCAWAAYWWSRTAAAFVRVLHCFLQGNHFAAMYVDDLLALFPQPAAPLMACLCVTLACGLGLPLSWHKLQLSSSIKWIGWSLHLEGSPRAFLPPDKQEVLLAALAPLCKPGTWVSRADLRRLLGRLCWFTAGAKWLKPFMCSWFRCLMKRKLVLQSLDAGQREELRRCLDAALVVREQCSLSDVQRGWILMEVGAQKVCSADALLCAVPKNGRVWCKLGDPDSLRIKITKDEAQLAKFFRAVIAAEVPVHLVSSWKPGVVAAADAFAEGARAGLGGWWLPSSLPLCPENICYFSIPLQPSDLPAWFLCEGKEDLQKYICALEALAQLVLLACQLQSDEQVDSGWIALRQLSDNMGVVGASAKALSMRSPLTEVLQSLGLFSAQHRVQLHISHVAGARNEWADWLSRGAGCCPSFWSKLEPSQRYKPDWEQLLSMCHAIS